MILENIYEALQKGQPPQSLNLATGVWHFFSGLCVGNEKAVYGA
jgi:hypothetical protein